MRSLTLKSTYSFEANKRSVYGAGVLQESLSYKTISIKIQFESIIYISKVL